MVVTAMNILRNTNLKEYEDDFMFAKAVKDRTKYDKFYEFTITIRQPNN